MTHPLLHLCSRATTFPGLAEQLAARCAQVSDWNALLIEADAQGVAPLAHWHLKNLQGVCPDQFRRGVRLLFLRHQHVNGVLMRALAEVLATLKQAGVDVLVLKGAGLCRTVYPEIGLRPMRDIDLLVRREQAQQAQDLLVAGGFKASNAPRPTDHFHLPSLHKNVDNIPVCIELHHGFFPDCPPYYRKPDFDDLQQRSLSYQLVETEARTLGHEDMLWHIFHHGLHMPLTYEPLKLISVADIVTLIEERFAVIDWPRMRTDYPEVLAALPMLHHLTPWQDQVLSTFSWKTAPAPAGVGQLFDGWPRLHLKEQKNRSLWAILRATLVPPDWWTQLYYGVNSRWGYLQCRWMTHPLHVLWWVRLYAAFLVPEPTAVSSLTLSQRIQRLGSMFKAIVRKF